jgi:hypothetical protein
MRASGGISPLSAAFPGPIRERHETLRKILDRILLVRTVWKVRSEKLHAA